MKPVINLIVFGLITMLPAPPTSIHWFWEESDSADETEPRLLKLSNMSASKQTGAGAAWESTSEK